MKTPIHHPAFLSLIGLILSPLAVAHASPPPADSVHFCQVLDYEEWERDHPRPAAKRLADLNVGEPRTVRMIYFLPKDRPFRQEVVDLMKVRIREVQTFYAEQMQAHGYGNKTFRFETDAQDEPLVHRVDGQHPDSYYQNPLYSRDEIRMFDLQENIYFIVVDASIGGGVGTRYNKKGGFAFVSGSVDFIIVAHELGHAFGLQHDFRDDAYIMSYGWTPDQLSACAAEFLSVHPYFNPDSLIDETLPPTVELISPRAYPAGLKSVSIRLKVGDSEGLHQVFLFAPTRGEFGINTLEVKACRGLSGERDTLVEFDYDGSIPSALSSSLSEPVAHPIQIRVVDTEGDVGETEFVLVEISPYHIATLEGHTDGVWAMAVSPDGGILASGAGTLDKSRDTTVRLWNVASREEIATLEGHTDGVWAMAFSRNGALLASGSRDGTILLWNVVSRTEVGSLKGHRSGVLSVAFSPDGALLASGSRDGAELWDVASRTEVSSLSIDEVHSVAFSPDGALLATGSNEGAEVWDVASRTKVGSLTMDRVRSMAFSSDGALLATGMSDDTVRLLDVASRAQIGILEEHTKNVTSVAFSPDGTLLASGSKDGRVILWDVLRRQKLVVFPNTGEVRSVVFLGDDATLASGSGLPGGAPGMIALWDVSEWTGSSEQEITAGDEEAAGEEDGELADDESSGEPQAWLMPDPSEVEFYADDPAWKTFTVHTNLDSVLVRANPSGSDLALEVAGGQQVPTRDYCPAEGNDRPTRGRRDGYSLHVKACQAGRTKLLLIDYDTGEVLQQYEVNVKIIDNDSAGEPQAWLMPNPAEVAFSADDPAWKTFTVHTNLDSVLVRANPSGSDPALEVAGGQQVPTSDYCPAEGNDRPTRGRRDGWSLHVKACQAGRTKLLLIDYDTDAVVQQYEVNVEAYTSASATTRLNPSYPNPFNSETVLSYTLPTASDIRLEVFTLNGQRVAVLHEGFQAAGYHTIAMDASALASGVYLYRLTTPEGRFVQKFTLLR